MFSNFCPHFVPVDFLICFDEIKWKLRLLGLESLEPEFKGDSQLSRRFCSLKRPHLLEAGAMHGFYAGIRSVSLSKRITSLRRNYVYQLKNIVT